MPDKKEMKLEKAPAQAQAKKKREPVSTSKIVATIIIAILVIALCSTGIIYLISDKAGTANTKYTFGSFNGEDIAIENGSVMYRQYSNLAAQYSDALSSGDFNTAYQVWYQAYSNALTITALNQLAKKAGVVVVQDAIDQMIVDQGVYNNESGVFDQSIYNSYTEQQRASVDQAFKQLYPYSVVYSDLLTTLTPDAEVQMISDLGNITRDFSYMVVDYNALPDENATAYLETNADLFRKVGLSMLTVADEETAKTIKSQLDSKELTWEDAVANNSTDDFKDAAGLRGMIASYTLASELGENAPVDTLLSMTEGQVSDPMATSAGTYRIFRCEAAAEAADPADSETISEVKSYLLTNEQEAFSPILGVAANEIATAAAADFDAAAAANGLAITSLKQIGLNPAQSQYFYFHDLGYLDANAGLSGAAAAGTDNYKALFAASKGDVLGPWLNGSSYVIVRVDSTDGLAESDGYATMLLNYYGYQLLAQDIASDVNASPKHTSNFISQFFSTVLGVSAE